MADKKLSEEMKREADRAERDNSVSYFKLHRMLERSDRVADLESRAERAERERDEALAQARRLEAYIVELAAFRWLVWEADNVTCIGAAVGDDDCFSWIGASTGESGYYNAKAPTAVALATALDPNWRGQ